MAHVMIGGRFAELHMHHGLPIWREEGGSVEVARISITGDRLEESVLLHPRYVPKGVDHEVIEVYGFRRGRTLDIFLDEPIQMGGVAYTILNFKGVGADADKPLVIHPNHWWLGEPLRGGDWGYSDESGHRLWGAMKLRSAQEAFTSTVLSDLAVPEVGYVACHSLPEGVSALVPTPEPLSQIVRAYNTNIRHGDPVRYVCSAGGFALDPAKAAQQDACALNAITSLFEQQKMLIVNGSIAGNRLLTGELLDRENYDVENLGDRSIHYFTNHKIRFIQEIVDTSRRALDGKSAEYLNHLKNLVLFPLDDFV
jgi:hypothetical protein